MLPQIDFGKAAFAQQAAEAIIAHLLSYTIGHLPRSFESDMLLFDRSVTPLVAITAGPSSLHFTFMRFLASWLALSSNQVPGRFTHDPALIRIRGVRLPFLMGWKPEDAILRVERAQPYPIHAFHQLHAPP